MGIAVAFETKTPRTWNSVITKEQVTDVGQPVNTWDTGRDSGRMMIGHKTRNECKQLISAVRVSEGKLQKPQDTEKKLGNVSVGNLTYLLTTWSRFFLE
jgi:hypothetical protein